MENLFLLLKKYPETPTFLGERHPNQDDCQNINENIESVFHDIVLGLVSCSIKDPIKSSEVNEWFFCICCSLVTMPTCNKNSNIKYTTL